MPTTSSTTSEQLLRLAQAVLDDGFGEHRDAIDDVVELARHRGVRPVLVEILTDHGAPTVARLRALGRVIVALSQAADQVPITPAAAGRPASVPSPRVLVSPAA